MTAESGLFPAEEFAARQARVRSKMQTAGLDALLISTPENIYYLTGLDHMGYFAYQMLVLPVNGEPMLITRAMEKATVADQVPDVKHYGYADGSAPVGGGLNAAPASARADSDAVDLRELGIDQDGSLFREPAIGRMSRDAPRAPVEMTCDVIAEHGLGNARLGLEEGGSFLTYRIAHGIKQGLSDATWLDGTGIVDQVRQVQSPLEVECTRRAAVISDAMMQAAVAATGELVNERDVMAAIYDAMFRRGGTYPGFVPLVRSTSSLAHEHGTWSDKQLAKDDLMFLEMSGCVRRYHAPMGRLVFVGGSAPESAHKALEVCLEAQLAAAATMRPGVAAGDVYEAWQSTLDRRGLGAYRRHHCGYSTGIGYPPSWSGGGVPVGLRPNSDLKLQEGMVFHLMSWLLRSSYGDSFLSDTALITADGCELLTSTSREMLVRA